jgi:hypothetical protein
MTPLETPEPAAAELVTGPGQAERCFDWRRMSTIGPRQVQIKAKDRRIADLREEILRLKEAISGEFE